MTKEQLQARLAQIKDQVFSLECSDDFLFSNTNGNLSVYRRLREEEREISAKLEDMA